MKIKKLLTVFVGVALTLSLAGCGFSIGTSSKSDDYSDVFKDPITSGKVLLLNNAGEVLGYGIGFVNDVPVGENVAGTMYAIAAPHSLDSLADMAMFSCPTLE